MSIETSFSKYGLQFEVTFKVDEYPDLSWIGEYTDRYTDGAINTFTMQGYVDHSKYKYFVACQSFSERLSGLRKYHLSERTARIAAAKELLDDYKLYESYNNGEWYMQGVIVTAYLDGVKVDSNSLWGVESNAGDEFMQEIVDDLVSQIMYELSDKGSELEQQANNLSDVAGKLQIIGDTYSESLLKGK